MKLTHYLAPGCASVRSINQMFLAALAKRGVPLKVIHTAERGRRTNPLRGMVLAVTVSRDFK